MSTREPRDPVPPTDELDPDAGLGVDGDPVAEPEPGAGIDPVAEGPEVTIAFSPRQILGGFALLAALIALLIRRRRTKK